MMSTGTLFTTGGLGGNGAAQQKANLDARRERAESAERRWAENQHRATHCPACNSASYEEREVPLSGDRDPLARHKAKVSAAPTPSVGWDSEERRRYRVGKNATADGEPWASGAALDFHVVIDGPVSKKAAEIQYRLNKAGIDLAAGKRIGSIAASGIGSRAVAMAPTREDAKRLADLLKDLGVRARTEAVGSDRYDVRMLSAGKKRVRLTSVIEGLTGLGNGPAYQAIQAAKEQPQTLLSGVSRGWAESVAACVAPFEVEVEIVPCRESGGGAPDTTSPESGDAANKFGDAPGLEPQGEPDGAAGVQRDEVESPTSDAPRAGGAGIAAYAGDLRELAALRDEGILTDEEFAEEKRRILDQARE